MPEKKIKNRLRQALILRNIEQKELADTLDVPRSRISKVASGMNIKIDMALRICDALNLTLNDIFYIADIPPTQKRIKRKKMRSIVIFKGKNYTEKEKEFLKELGAENLIQES